MRIAPSLACVFTLTASAVFAAPAEQFTSNAFWFDHWGDLSNAQMTVTAPDGRVEEVFADSTTPIYKLGGTEVVDGIYRYELKAATSETEKIVNPVDNGRGDQARDEVAVPFYMEGSFVVSRGVIIIPEDIQEEGGPEYSTPSGDGG